MFHKSKHFWCPKFHQLTKINTQGLQYLAPLPLLPSSPFHQVHISHQQQLCIPSLGYHCMCPCGQGGKEAFQWARAFAIRHEYAPFFVVLYPFPQLLLFHSTLSTSIIKTKPSRFKNSSFLTRFPLTLLPLPPFFLFCQKAWIRSTGNPSPVLQQRGRRRGAAPAFTLGMWQWTLCQGKATSFRQQEEKSSPPPSAASRATVAPAPTPFPRPAAPPFRLQ